MIESILVPVDDSEMSNSAVEYAVTELDADTVTAVHVINVTEVRTPSGIEAAHVDRKELLEAYRTQAADILDDAAAVAAEHGVEIETEIAEGRVARTIVDYAETNDVDQIVIGSHGRTGPTRILLGSVAESVARRSPVPVTIVR